MTTNIVFIRFYKVKSCRFFLMSTFIVFIRFYKVKLWVLTDEH